MSTYYETWAYVSCHVSHSELIGININQIKILN